MPLPVLLNIGSALSAIFWPHAAASTSGAAAVAGSANAAKDASVAGAAASGSSAAATGAKVRRRCASHAPCIAARHAAHLAAGSAESASVADSDARALAQAAGVDGAFRTGVVGTAEAGREASEAWTATKVAALAACTLGTARLTATAKAAGGPAAEAASDAAADEKAA